MGWEARVYHSFIVVRQVLDLPQAMVGIRPAENVVGADSQDHVDQAQDRRKRLPKC
jgi:hypothetical protein